MLPELKITAIDLRYTRRVYRNEVTKFGTVEYEWAKELDSLHGL